MENKKEYCEKLLGKYKYFYERAPKAQRITTDDKYKEQYRFSDKERDELYFLKEKLKNECRDYLSQTEQNELDR